LAAEASADVKGGELRFARERPLLALLHFVDTLADGPWKKKKRGKRFYVIGAPAMRD